MRKLIFCCVLILLSVIQAGAARKLVKGVNPSEIQSFTDKVAGHLCTRANTVHPLEAESICWYNDKTVEIYFSSALGEQPLRTGDIEWIYSTARNMLSKKFPKCRIRIFTDKKPVEDLASRWYSRETYHPGIWNDPDAEKAIETYSKEYAAVAGNIPGGVFSFVHSSKSKLDTVKVSYIGHSSGMDGSSTQKGNDRQWVRPSEEAGVGISRGLEGKNIALWDSHGMFYNRTKGQWTWQRPHLFQTCEDLLSSDIALNYLVPMLENAGAYVVMPKERDINTDEVIVDEGVRGWSERGGWTKAPNPGFGVAGGAVREGQNPFGRGNVRQVKVAGGSASGNAGARWEPELPKAGEYAVYVSYQSLPNGTTAAYTVHHCGEKSTFYVNQRMGGGTWVYLGTFFFDQGKGDGKAPRNGVTLSNRTVPGVEYSGKEVITADAVKFGGGYGNVIREGKCSGMPRFMEGSRYWLQYAGYPENMYTPFDEENDYKDDYSSRALWVNALSGGSVVNPYMSGYGVPLDLSFALHTDAGLSVNDSIVGTLAIHTTRSNNREFLADGRSRMINRELCDIIQTQVVEDLRTLVGPSWNRRGMWDKSYLECREPEVPSMILELLSHQNLADMRFATDPVFKFTVARAIYKGMLTFFKATAGLDYDVQPLPVEDFCAVNRDGKTFLSWNPGEDALEPSAVPEGYLIYRRVINPSEATGEMLRRPDRHFGFVLDGYTESTEYISPQPLENGKVYSYKVVAVNSGGRSFPSEILSVCSGEKGQVLAVNCFDRLSAPDCYGVTDTLEGGMMPWKDRGVQWCRDISIAGDQYSFDKKDEYVDDDHPGFGASWSDYDTLVACGNTFDYPLIHCAAMSLAGYGFSSCSRGALENISLSDFRVLDIIGGKQKGGGRYSPVLTPEIMAAARETAGWRGTVIVSGAYLFSDPVAVQEPSVREFAGEVLKVKYLSPVHPVGVESVSGERFRSDLPVIPNSSFYSLESCDALSGSERGTRALMRYSNHGPSACQYYGGKDYRVIVAGFPLEAVDFHHLYMTLKAAL